jgi:hypothetical protein
MKTLATIIVLSVTVGERIVDVLQPFAYLAAIAGVGVACWILVALLRIEQAESASRQRRADAEFAKAHKVVK